MSITTRKPGRDFDWNFNTLYGTDGEYNIEGGVNLPIAGNFSVRLAAKVSGMDGYISTREGDAPDKESEQFRISFDWQPTDSWQSEFRFDYGDAETVGALAFQLVDCPVPEGFASGTACRLYLLNNGGDIDDELDYDSDTALDFVTLEHKEAAWTNTFDIGEDSKLMLKTAYYEHESDALFTGIPFLYEHDPASGLPPFSKALPGVSDPFPIAFFEEFDQFSQEVRFQTDTGGFLDVMVGAYYDRQNFDFQNQPGFFFNDFGAIVAFLGIPGVTVGAGDYISAVGDYDAENETYSAFAAFTLRPTERTIVNIGGRYTRFDKWATRSSSRGFTDPTLSSYEVFGPVDDFAVNLILGGNRDDFSPNNRTDEEFMPSVSVQHDLTDNMMAYASYSEGFKAGGFSTGNNPDIFEPEFVDAYEVGMKGVFLDHRLRLNLALFLNEFEDFQETVQLPQGVSLVSVIRNAGKLEARGVELDGTLVVTDNLDFSASIAYLDSIYEDFTNAPCTGRQIIEAGGSRLPCAQDLSGKRRAYAPEWSGNIAANWTVPFDNYNLTFSPMVFFSDEYFLTATADPWQVQHGYAKLDMRVALSPSSEKWTLSLLGKNLMDRTTATFSEAVINSDGSSRQIVARPLSVALQFSMRY